MRVIFFTLFLLLFASSGFAQDRRSVVNAVLGDVSWSGPGAPEEASENARLSAHLHYVHALLRPRAPSLPTSVRLRRRALLGALLAYADDGRFPRRDADAHVGRRPRFIDPSGVHCAVGHLMAQSGAGDLARRIARTENDAFVDEITTPGVSEWASRNGFTLRELAMIQPSYDQAPTAESERQRIDRELDAATLSCAREHTPVNSFRIRVRGDGGAGRVTARGRSRFVACVVERLQGRPAAYDGVSPPFDFPLEVQVKSPQRMLQNSLAAVVLGGGYSQCIPTPGATPEYAAVEVSVTQRSRSVRVRTYPRNVPAANCLAAFVHGRLRDYAPGDWNLRASAVLPVAPLVSDAWLARSIDSLTVNAAAHCMAELELSDAAPVTVEVRARLDAPAYEVEVRGDAPELAACIEGKLAQSLREVTNRDRGAQGLFFRIDGDATASREVQPQTYEVLMRRDDRSRTLY